ncbi:hypothetical protein OURE66S_00928 [Oligella ureolytica]
MVPSSWVLCDLGDFMDFKNGLNADKSQYGYGLKFVNVMDVFGNDILTEDKIIGRVNVAESQLEANLLNFGDVLFNRTSETFDEIAMLAVYLDDKPAVFGGFVIRARPNSGVLVPEYSVYNNCLLGKSDYWMRMGLGFRAEWRKVEAWALLQI